MASSFSERIKRSEPRTVSVAPRAVHDVVRSTGMPLDHETRSTFNSRFGHDFSRVRIHTDTRAAESARAINARAYTVGSHVVFGAGEAGSAVGENDSDSVLAHELVHVMQSADTSITHPLPIGRADTGLERQAGALATNHSTSAASTPAFSMQRQSVPMLHRMPGRSEHDTDGLPRSSAPLGGWSSESGGTRIKPDKLDITPEELKEIYPQLAKDAAADSPRVTEEKIESFAAYLSEAFKLMRIDTVEAQASYLGHGAVESDQFRRFTETQGWKQWYEEDPTAINLDTKWLNDAGDNPKYPSYKMGGTINPNSDKSWQSSYIGRGPVQVTHTHNYKKVLAKMEEMADEYEAAGEKAKAATLREAVEAIRADPRQAANPKYTFLFSAAHEKESGGDVRVGDVERDAATFSGTGNESTWVTGGAKEEAWKATLKRDAWRRAYDVLMRKADVDVPDKDPATYRGPGNDRIGNRVPA